MDKTAIRNFAIEARKILMKSAITEAGFYGITKDGCKDPVQKGNDFEVYETVAGTENRIFGDDIKRRANLVQAIKTLGFEQVIEETAYTWFNRIIAIRFMEVNNYLPTRVRVLSSETGSGTPDIITQADTVELNLTLDELEKIQTAKRENRYDDAFRMLFIKQCNELNAILPGLFEKTDDYMELLLKITFTGDGVIRMLVDSIPEDNFNVETEGQVEIIGWMYQYYNTELKDDTFAKLKKNVKITKERIPAATQLFTPDWIVRYMVENSLGRVWIEHLRAANPSVDEKAKAEEFGWKYYLPEAEQDDDVQAQLVEIRKSYKDLTPQDITCIDPCMGSGHILVYMFDVLMDIYRSEGFSEREAVFDILEKNIRGLDIDRRAYQLSYFALMMKARGYNRIFFRGHEDLDGNRVQAVPQVYAIEESNSVDREQLRYFGAGLDELSKNNALNQLNGLIDSLKDAKEYGSILNIENYDWNLLRTYVAGINEEGQASLFGYMAYQSSALLKRIISVGEVLACRYDSVVTNPPYMGSNGMDKSLTDYLVSNYPETKYDLSTVMMERSLKYAKHGGYISMINIPVWMFLSSYEKLRKRLLNDCTFTNMAHFGRGVFGSDFGTTSFVIRNLKQDNYCGYYKKLYKRQGAVDSLDEKLEMFFDEQLNYYTKQEDFYLIPGYPIAYWVKNKELFTVGEPLEMIANPRQGLKTLDNERFLRNWYEVDFTKVGFDFSSLEDAKASKKKWFPINHGGEYHKYYGNNCILVNWENDGEEMKKLAVDKYNSITRTITNMGSYFKEGITWTVISSASTSFRRYYKGFIFSNSGQSIVPETPELLDYLTGLLNTKIVQYILAVLSPTLGFESGYLKKIAIRVDDNYRQEVETLTREAIQISKEDWDSFETSWDFKKHPFIQYKTTGLIKDAFENWREVTNQRYQRMKDIQQRLNEIFIDIYGLSDELTPEIDERDITLSMADKKEDAESFVSYLVGCIFGRYSVDTDGIVYAGGEWETDGYKTITVDMDNIIPITDEEYLEDDIVNRICNAIAAIYGEENLDANIAFIADSLEVSGVNPKDELRHYFQGDFFKKHCSTYSFGSSGRKPIYWMFDAGKQNSFKCLIYLHRYEEDTVGLIRSDYLSKVQNAIENALKNAEYAINTSGSAVDRAQATKKRDKYIKQLAEIRAYYPALSHIALQRIELNLDDGVKANYAKFQGIEVSVEGEKKQKINLLAKI